MPVFVYASPLILGLLLPLFLHPGRPDKKSRGAQTLSLLAVIAAFLLALACVIGVWQLVAPSPRFSLSFLNAAGLLAFLFGWLALVAGGYYLLCALLSNKTLAYVILSGLIILMNTTVFYINPIINAAGPEHQVRQWVIESAVVVNPVLTVAANFFKHDLLRSGLMYSLCDIGPYYFYGYAGWASALLFYALSGLAALAASFFLLHRMKGNYETD